MDGKRPDVTDEDIGMRAFQLRKEKAVERAMERLRFGLGDMWSLFSEIDRSDLKWIIGELWAYEKRADWNDLRFSVLTASDVRAIATYAHGLRNEPRGAVETLETVGDIIRAAAEREAAPPTGPSDDARSSS